MFSYATLISLYCLDLDAFIFICGNNEFISLVTLNVEIFLSETWIPDTPNNWIPYVVLMELNF